MENKNFLSLYNSLFSKEEWEQNRKEGWDIFICHGSGSGDFQIQKIDGETTFNTDLGAMFFVKTMANLKSLRHMRTIEFITIANPKEIELINTIEI
jgi:hypothetical protein